LPHLPADAAWRLKVILAFTTLYLVWGSTYLAIRVGVTMLPPALFAGARFVIAGVLLAGYAHLAGQRLPRTRKEWRTIAVAAMLLLVCANGLVVWSEQWLASNLAALIAATTALWLAAIGALGARGHKLSRQTLFGLLLGILGVALLLLPDGRLPDGYLPAAMAMLAATVAWAAGSIYVKHARPSTPPIMSAALQSLLAGAVLSLIGLGSGELPRWVWTRESALAVLYLAVFGSCFAYAAYVWLLHEVSPAALGTYAYINPLIAVLLGAAWLGETLTSVQFAGMAVILAGVGLVSVASSRRAPAIRQP
jgi:drug/metabolite transporter (DMT)-like permease